MSKVHVSPRALRRAGIRAMLLESGGDVDLVAVNFGIQPRTVVRIYLDDDLREEIVKRCAARLSPVLDARPPEKK